MDVTLSNGTQVEGIKQADGSTLLVILPEDRPMTESEWNEYCELARKQNAEHLAKMKAERVAKNRASFEADKSRLKTVSR